MMKALVICIQYRIPDVLVHCMYRWEETVLKRVGEMVADSGEKAEKQEDEAEGVLDAPVAETKVVDERTEDEAVDQALHALYPAIPTALTELDKEHKVWQVLSLFEYHASVRL
jgi:hypothetical protein